MGASAQLGMPQGEEGWLAPGFAPKMLHSIRFKIILTRAALMAAFSFQFNPKIGSSRQGLNLVFPLLKQMSCRM
jgi:hypothetical protein